MALTQISTQGIKDGTITGSDLATNVDLVDNQKLRLGTSNEKSEIYNDGDDLFINHTEAGYLQLQGNYGVLLQRHNGTENLLRALSNGAVELYHDNNKKFETTSYGAFVNGRLSLDDSNKITLGDSMDLQIYHDGSNSYISESGTGDLIIESSHIVFKDNGTEVFETTNTGARLVDNMKLLFGSGNDLEIFHNGFNSKIADVGTGALILSGSTVKIENGASSENQAVFNEDGAVELYYDNSKKFETTSDGVAVTGQLSLTADLNMEDGDQIEMGTDNDFKIFHSGFNYLESHNDVEVHINAYTGGSTENMAKFKPNGAVELYYDNSKKFETRSTGVLVSGSLTADGGNAITLGDNKKIVLGTGSDLQIYHDGSNSVIAAANTGDLQIFAQADDILLQAADNIFIKPLNGESGLNVLSNGAVELYHNNVKKIFTEAEGASVCGDGSDVHLRLRDSSDNVRGIVHATASVDVGFITADATAWLFRVHDDGSYQHYGSEISDRDKKDNITTISSTSLDKVTKLVPKTFTFKQDETGKVPTDKVFTGFIAQEVKEHLPNLVTGTDGQKDMTVDYNGILAHAVKAITELSAEVEILKTKVAALEAA